MHSSVSFTDLAIFYFKIVALSKIVVTEHI